MSALLLEIRPALASPSSEVPPAPFLAMVAALAGALAPWLLLVSAYAGLTRSAAACFAGAAPI